MSILQAACPCCMPMLHVPAACPCCLLCCMSMLLALLLVHAACPGRMSILHVLAACICRMSMSHVWSNPLTDNGQWIVGLCKLLTFNIVNF
jgi:hypothetical protein